MITLDEFKKVELRAARILRVEEIPGKDRLYKLIIDLGEERQIVAGIKPYYQPSELEGRTILVVANLEPARVGGVESRGMLLAVRDRSGRYVVVEPSGDVEPGTAAS